MCGAGGHHEDPPLRSEAARCEKALDLVAVFAVFCDGEAPLDDGAFADAGVVPDHTSQTPI